MKKPLVSILSPCYNGENYVGRFIESIIKQTYRPLQFILVNDGSNDRTDEVIELYRKKIEESGIEFIYLVQENKGQASAVNFGLKKVTGEYLTWPDSDDILTKDSVEKKLDFLEKNQEYAFVRSDAYYFAEDNLEKPLRSLDRKSPKRFDKCIFDRLLFEQNMYSIPGCYMVRMESLDCVIKNREIYCSKGGQNWQLQLPMAYKYKCGYVDEKLYYYVIRQNSHSHQVKKDDKLRQWERYDILKDIITNTVGKIDDFDHKKYDKLIEQKYIRFKFVWSINHGYDDDAKSFYTFLCNNDCLRKSDKLFFRYRKNKYICKLIRSINKIFYYLGYYYF